MMHMTMMDVTMMHMTMMDVTMMHMTMMHMTMMDVTMMHMTMMDRTTHCLPTTRMVGSIARRQRLTPMATDGAGKTTAAASCAKRRH